MVVEATGLSPDAGEALSVTRRESGLCIATLRRPRALNAIDSDLVDRLDALVAQLEREPARGLVVTGEGRAFCAGADLREIGSLEGADAFDEFIGRVGSLVGRIRRLPFPTAAAINGDAFGGGFELALACDLRLVEPTARLGFPEVRLGLLPGAGGCIAASRLPPAIGAQLLMSGRSLDARAAAAYGLVNEVTNTSEVLNRTEEVLMSIIEMPSRALAAAKYLLAVLPHVTDDEASEIERTAVSRLYRSDDTRRRIADFTGRPT